MADPIPPIQQQDTQSSSPFVAQQTSPFGEDAAADAEKTTNDNVATPSRTGTLALALIQKQHNASIDNLSDTLEAALGQANQIITSGQEATARMQAVVDGTQERMKGLQGIVGTNDPHTGALFTPELVHNVQQTTAADRANRMEDLSHGALEEQAVHAIQDKLAAGDEVGARALYNRLDPAKNSSFGVMRDFYQRNLMIANAVEKAGFDANEEPIWHKVLTVIATLPESFLLKTARENSGNVADGTAGYHSSLLRSILDPGGELGKQILAWQSMDITQQGKYLPTLLKNIQSNSSQFGLSDPGKAAEMLSMFKTGIDSWQRAGIDAGNALDVAMIAPLFKSGAGLAHISDVITGMGARSAATNRVANAFEIAAKEGLPAMTQKTAVVPDELIEQGLPKSINPLLIPEAKGVTKSSLLSSTAHLNPDFVPAGIERVSRAGDVADQVAYAREVMNSPDFQVISAPNRFFSEEERHVAIQDAVATIKARTNSNVLDYEPQTVRLSNGQEVTQLNVTINKPFASEDEALNWLRNQGYGADPSNVEMRGQKPKIYKDNPGGDWLERAKLKAFQGEGPLAQRGLSGSPTGSVHNIKIPVDSIKELPGANGEMPGPGKPKYAALSKSVDEHGFTDKSPILIRVNPKGEAYIMEGNNRVKIASERGVKEISAEIQFIGGSEELPSHIGQVIQDTSGQFFPRVKMNVRETGFYTNDLNPPKQHFMARWFGTPFTTSDSRLAAKGTASGQVQQQWMREIKDLNKTVTKLSPTDRTYLREVIQRGVNESRWLSPTEFDTIWERATGKLPNEKVKASYYNYRTANDIDFEMRNANAYADLATRGVEKVRFNALGKEVDKLGAVEHDLKVPDEPILETSTGVTHKPGELTEARLKELEGEGHFIVTTEEPVRMPDGTHMRKFLVKKGELEANRLPDYVLPYSEGGHRVYADKFFVKQAKYITTADNAARLDKPQVFVTGATKADVARWARVMEEARLAVRDGKDAAFLDQSVFKGQRGLPTGEDFMKGLKDGTWTTDHPFEALFDRELPSEYAKSGGRYAEEEAGANGFYRTNGQLYYSAKGDALRNVSGELAPTIDPFKMQNNALFNVARLSSFDDFKTSSINRWVNTYGQFLEYRQGATPAEVFNSATVSRGATRDLVHQIEGQREAIRRMLNFRGSFDMEKENALRRLHEWMVGDTDSELRKWASKAPLWVMDHNPVNMLRGLTFDMKLGMFNPGQLFVQVSTAFSAMAMSPSAGLKGMFTIPAMIAYRTALKNGIGDNVLDLLTKRGFHKLAGFGSEAEFKEYMKFLDKSGIFAFGDSHLLVNTSHPAAAYSFLSKQDAVRTAGRFFFNRAEDANRLVAARIAYDEAVKKFGSADFKNFEFNEHFRARTENYSFNMSQTSAAAWQKGLLSIPTQFWAYNWRMMEALVGKQFTTAQKARLLTAQVFMAGAAGFPGAGLVVDYINNKTGSAPRLGANPNDPRGQPSVGEQAWATVQRGMVDELVHLTTGADVQIGQRLGTGDFFQQTAEKLMGYSEYGAQTTPADMLGGATYSVFGEAMGSAFALVQHFAAAETGGENPYEMTQNDWDTMFKQVSSINNIAFKAYFAKQYGIYTSQKGKVLIDGLPKADAAFFALGFAPGELRDRSAGMEWKRNRQDMVQNAADFVNSRWQESVREPDKFEQNARIVSAFVNMLPPEQKMEVLQKAHLSRDPSDYSRLLRIRQSTQTSDEAIQELDQMFNQPEPPEQTNEVQENTNG